MKKILILGAGDFQFPLVREASETCEVFLVAPVIDEKFSPYIKGKLLCDIRQEETILAFARSAGIDGVITDQTDIAVRTVAYVTQKMGLPGIGYDVSCLFTDKARMRKKLAELDIPRLPNKLVFSLEEARKYFLKFGEEVIIKPTSSQGSRGVQACASLTELEKKYAESARWSRDGGVIIEKLVKGREFFVESILYDYKYKTLICGDTNYFDIPDAFAAKNRIVPSTAEPSLRKRVCELDKKIITGFGLKQGITHSEYIMDGENIYLLETAARGGGVFISSDLIRLSTGVHTEEFLVNIALGQQKELPATVEQRCVCGYIALFVPRGRVVSVKGVEEVQALPYVHNNQLDRLTVGMENMSGNTDKTSRLAMIVSAETREQFEERAKKIQSILVAEVQTNDGIQGLIWD